MKRIFNRFLICILIVMIICNFSLGTFCNVSYGFEFSIGGIIDMIARGLFILPLALGIQGIMLTVTGLVRIGASAGPTSVADFLVQPFHVLFNQIPLLDVNLLNLNPENVSPDGPVMTFRYAIAGWYYSIRLLAAMILAVVLIYVGIRMAISTIAQEKAMYKKMLVDWTVSIVLLFLLHYIMIFTFACNEALVKAIENAAETSGVDKKMSDFINKIYAEIFITGSFAQALGMVIVYGMIVAQTVSFVLSYLKRMFTVGFLIVIAPFITVTYSIDKMGDGKSQALNTWLKEFIFNILLQPFQCILYVVFAGNAIELIKADDVGFSGLAFAIFAVLSLQFIKEGEKIVKKIFGFDKASSLVDMAAGAAMTAAGLAKGKEWGGKLGSAASKAKNVVATNPKVQALQQERREKKANKRAARASQRAEKAKSKPQSALGKKLDKFVESRMEKAKVKDRESAVNLAEQRLRAQGVNRSPNEQEISAALSTIKQNRIAKADKRKNGFAKVGSAALSVGKDFGKLAYKNKDKLIGAGVGFLASGIGLGSGDFMSIKEGVIAGQVGSGIMEGWFKNSLKTLKQDTQTNIQNISNFTGNIDKDNIMAEAYALGESDGFKDISKELKDLKQKLSMLGVANPNSLTGNLSQRVLSGNVNANTLDELVKDVPEENKEQAKDALAGYGTLLAQKQLYDNIKTAEGMNIDRERLAGIVTINSNTETNSEAKTNNSETTKEVKKIVKEIQDTGILEADIDKTNANIESLKRALESFENAKPEQQETIVKVLNENSTNKNFNTPDDVKQLLESKINGGE